MTLEKNLTDLAEAIGADVKEILDRLDKPSLKVVSTSSYTVTAGDAGSALLLTQESTTLNLSAMPAPSSLVISCATGASVTIEGHSLAPGEAGIVSRDDSGDFTYAGFSTEFDLTIPAEPAYFSLWGDTPQLSATITEDSVFIYAGAPFAVIDKLKAQGKRVYGYLPVGSITSWSSEFDVFPASLLLDDMGWGEYYLDISNLELLLPFVAGWIKRAASQGYDGLIAEGVAEYFWRALSKNITQQQVIDYMSAVRDLIIESRMVPILEGAPEYPSSFISEFGGLMVLQAFQYGEASLLVPWAVSGKPVWILETIALTGVCPAVAEYPNVYAARFTDTSFISPPIATCY